MSRGTNQPDREPQDPRRTDDRWVPSPPGASRDEFPVIDLEPDLPPVPPAPRQAPPPPGRGGPVRRASPTNTGPRASTPFDSFAWDFDAPVPPAPAPPATPDSGDASGDDDFGDPGAPNRNGPDHRDAAPEPDVIDADASQADAGDPPRPQGPTGSAAPQPVAPAVAPVRAPPPIAPTGPDAFGWEAPPMEAAPIVAPPPPPPRPPLTSVLATRRVAAPGGAPGMAKPPAVTGGRPRSLGDDDDDKVVAAEAEPAADVRAGRREGAERRPLALPPGAPGPGPRPLANDNAPADPMSFDMLTPPGPGPAAAEGEAAPVGGAAVLVTVCEPLFQLVCRANRMKRSGQKTNRFEPGAMREEFAAAFDALAAAALRAGRADDLGRVSNPLRHFVDVLMARGGFPWGENWRPLATGGAADATLLRATADALDDQGPRADERVEVLHTCLSFCADLLSPPSGLPAPEELLERTGQRPSRGGADGQPICPSAYEGVYTRSILPPIGRRIRTLIAISVGLLLLAVAGAVVLNVQYARSMSTSIEKVDKAMRDAAGKAAAEP